MVVIGGIEDALSSRLPQGFEVKPEEPESSYTRAETLASETHGSYGELPKTQPYGTMFSQ